jgi:hypothetical protein
MIHRLFPLPAVTLFPSPFKGEAGRGMVLLRAKSRRP